MGSGEEYAWGGGGDDLLGHLLCNHYLYTCNSSNLPFRLGERGPGTSNRGRDALDTLPGHWAVGGRARRCICGDSATGHGWPPQARLTSLPWKRCQWAVWGQGALGFAL